MIGNLLVLVILQKSKINKILSLNIRVKLLFFYFYFFQGVNYWHNPTTLILLQNGTFHT